MGIVISGIYFQTLLKVRSSFFELAGIVINSP